MQIAPTTITTKGQVTIPAPIRKALNLKTGDKVKFTLNEQNKVEIKLEKNQSLMSLYGSLKPKIKYKKDADIYAIIKEEERDWPKAANARDNIILAKIK